MKRIIEHIINILIGQKKPLFLPIRIDENKKRLMSFLTLIVSTIMASAATEVVPQATGMSEDTKSWLLICMAVFQLILIYTIVGIIKNLSGNKELWVSAFAKKGMKGAALVLLSVSSYSAMAASSASQPVYASMFASEGIQNLLLAINGALLVFILILLGTLKSMLSALNAAKTQGEEVVTEDFFSRLMKNMTDAVPVEQEEDVMTDHEYDGIKELDNNLPPWWVAGFYITIVASVIYIGYYHFYLDGKIMENEFNSAMTKAQKEKEAYLASLGNLVDETNVELLVDESTLAKGKTIFLENCAACHGQKGEGGIGPNLTDKYWLHGGGVKNIFSTVKYGVVEKGMISWKDQLTPPQIQQVSSYIVRLEGTNPPNPKDPQGEIWEEEVKEESATTEKEELVEAKPVENIEHN